MKFSLIFLGLFAVATAAPLAIRRAEHAPAGVVSGRDIQTGDMLRRSDNSPIQVVRANDDSIKRNLGENLETRQVEEAIEIVEAVVELVTGLIDAINEDNTKRGQFTIDTVTQSGEQWPGFNWVICHTDHTTAFDGTQGTDWGHTHHELDVTFGTIGFELYWFRSGTFTRNGDGGYLNWAYEDWWLPLLSIT
ncbi:ectomycorrhiza-regulated small secreted protein [Laccaria bicolor S238N-H82]|uniref:Ectomycorrhiza-regulated small secreted protein n=1 Tax=Laccaria bicolor (strain S238N-H82 / ATCC MYA-4686) TaxID=486041 RepID=B0DW71_LACBS|nr:ectomycorrhiza-regulated small secreted protein [Laccaria bicolor S238N-H82]EDR01178.1 ectomycorrhiza-regulated small secreted protein [Laccaria bicolor S238N-H82]|eukprot:XP_001888220.1 ectomycorrhiza-regulated small secreted protein [Laccaria bicolor S238N-H82]